MSIISIILNWLIVAAILYSGAVAWHLYASFRAKSFLLAVFAMSYAFIIQAWLAADAMTPRNLFPRSDLSISLAGGFYFLLAAGYWGFHKGLDAARKIRYGRRKDDKKEEQK